MQPGRAPTERDRIEHLVAVRFPLARTLRRGKIALSSETAQLQKDVDGYRSELGKLSAPELDAKFLETQREEAERARVKAEQYEQSLHFHLPAANADFDHWSKAAHWTLDEAIALSFGKAPEKVRWDNVQGFVGISSFGFQYSRRRDLALRALQWKQLFDPVLPGIFLAWAKRTDIPVPAELIAVVEARGVQIADWKTLYDESQTVWEKRYGDLEKRYGEMKGLFEQSQANARENHDKWLELSDRGNGLIASLKERIAMLEREASQAAVPITEKSLGSKEQESLLKLVIGMAVIGYRYDPKAERSPHIAEIANDITLAGLSLDADTVRKWLRAAAELLPPK